MAELFPAATGTSLLDSAAKELQAVAGTAVAASETGPVDRPQTAAPELTISPDLLRRLPRPGLLSALSPTLRTAFGALRRNKLRSALTTLGVIIGVGAVIAMMEIGQGSKAALEATIASMGANTIMVQSGAAASGGVSFGMGSTPTLTPQDGEQILRQCPAVANMAPLVSTRTQVIYGRKNWVPMFICGTTPSYLAIRQWESLDEGECFTEQDVRQGNKVCLIGRTLVRELFEGQSPIGKEIRLQNVAMRVIGVLEQKGANMVGMDQDDIVLAPWTTIKYRVSGTTLANTNQSAAAAASSSPGAVNTLNTLYPSSTALYPAATTTEQADLPQPVRFANIDQLYVQAVSSDHIDEAMEQITQVVHRQHHIAGEGRRLQPPQHGRGAGRPGLRHESDGRAAVVRGRHLPGGRRRGHHEHHARLGHRADPGDRPADGRRRPLGQHPAAVPRRGRALVPAGRRHRHRHGTRLLDPGADLAPLAHRDLAAGDPRLGRRLGGGGRDVRLVPRLEGVRTGPHRGPAVRVIEDRSSIAESTGCGVGTTETRYDAYLGTHHDRAGDRRGIEPGHGRASVEGDEIFSDRFFAAQVPFVPAGR